MPAFTTIAASAGLAATAAGTGMSVGQLIKQNKLQAQADKAAELAMAEAKKRTEKNFMASLAIPKLGYDNARRELASQYAQAMEAGREGEARGLGATVGRVAAAATNAQNQIAQQQEKELYDLQLATAAEDARLADIGAQLNLEEVAGAQAASAQAWEAKQKAMGDIASGVTTMAGQVASLAPIYGKTKQTRMLNKAFDQANTYQGYSPEEIQSRFTQFLGSDAGKDYRTFFPGTTDAAGAYTPFTTYSPIQAKDMMTGDQFFASLNQLSPAQLEKILTAFQGSPSFK